MNLQHHLLMTLSSGKPSYYVAKSGDDSTGDGSITSPWLTLDKALSAAPIEGGYTIKVGTGTYAEDTDSGGYLYVDRSFVATVRIQPSGGTVTITDTGGTDYCVRVGNTNTNLIFDNVTIEQSGSNSAATVHLDNGASIQMDNCTIVTHNNGIYAASASAICAGIFTNCTFERRSSDYGTTIRAAYLTAGGDGINNFSFSNCDMAGYGTGAGQGTIEITATNASGANTINISGGTITATANYAVSIEGGELNLTNVTISSDSSVAVVYGSDATASYASTGVTSGCTISSNSSHAMIIGSLSDGVQMDTTTINGGDYGLVLKECVNAIVDDCDLNGGTSAGCYLKAAVDTTVQYSRINADTLYAVLLAVNPTTGNKNENITLTHNEITAIGSADCMAWGNDSHDNGGGVVDYNTYDFDGSSGNVGDVRSATNITTLGALQSAWSDYDNTDNDANSTVIGDALSPLSLVSPAEGALTEGNMGTSYAGETITVSGGSGVVTFAISDGALPAGLSLDTDTGVISGTPTQPLVTNHAVQITVTDDDVSVDPLVLDYTITIHYAGNIVSAGVSPNIGVSDHSIELTINALPASGSATGRVRYQDDTHEIFWGINTSGQLTLYEDNAGLTLLGSFTGIVNTDVIRFEATGTSLKVYQNDVLKIDTTSTIAQSATNIVIYAGSSGNQDYDVIAM